ncbi:hypothetical protein PTSG_00035 [Salpingoeca rosetta]|uniref:Exocyst complex component Sec3 PIP2-binding N-terminal domain-containing protein n=1 Tax=Salpingoeca rosetta (strain ATCC 50818 / BSB-021) TaxID=946362 RepID=F2TVC3_SALR5|nr:uncharacterized protein PTSG_00035 [Salpingoeca rosetta]EGD72019.1 hypothetical protein PTSG_00035 [Salpingoeca rosetta]|eukprot:XP_004998591.1 hypothetical protein PTSG_00035 [Salpingoeca rosetta]
MFSLQRVVFDEAAERLVAALAASRPGKKEKKTKTNFLCLTVKTNESFLHRVRVTTDESYTKKKTWPLQALTAIDNVAPDSRQFILTFDRSYEWIAPNVTEKQRFLEAIVKSCRRYNKTLPQLANFQSIPGGGITVALHEHMPSAVPDENQQSDDDPYQESAAATLSKQQQEEMAAVFEKYDWATTDVRALSESLQKELQAVESANVHAMISSEVQVTRLLGRVDDALSKLDRLEQCISDYDGIVKRVSDQMRMINVQQDNFVSLGEYTRQLTDFLTFSKSHVNALTHPDFNTAPGLRLTVEAANRLYSLLHTGLKPGGTVVLC